MKSDFERNIKVTMNEVYQGEMRRSSTTLNYGICNYFFGEILYPETAKKLRTTSVTKTLSRDIESGWLVLSQNGLKHSHRLVAMYQSVNYQNSYTVTVTSLDQIKTKTTTAQMFSINQCRCVSASNHLSQRLYHDLICSHYGIASPYFFLMSHYHQLLS